MQTVWRKEVLGEGDVLMQCPFVRARPRPGLSWQNLTCCAGAQCTFCVVRHSAEPPALVHCDKEGCGKLSCNTCKKEVPRGDESDSDVSDSEARMDGVCAAVAFHTACSVHAPVKEALDEVARDFTSRKCPGCNTRGMKDDNCTHMSCEHCGTAWCYFCGLAAANVDAADGNGKVLYRHNEQWRSNPKRCPMHLVSICEEDDTWPEEDEECLLKLHTTLGKRALRDVQARFPRAAIAAAVAHIPALAAAGFDPLEPVTEADTQLFTRREDSDDEGESESESEAMEEDD